MKTFLNILLGLATVIIVVSLINLGIKAFHPEPEYPDYPFEARNMAPYPGNLTCESGDQKCYELREKFVEEDARSLEVQEAFDKEQRAYNDAIENYNRDFFIIANIVGILVFVLGFMILLKTTFASQGVMIGVMMSGLIAIIEGYARGWNSTNDLLKFFVGLVIAILIIGGSTWLMQKFFKRKSH